MIFFSRSGLATVRAAAAFDAVPIRLMAAAVLVTVVVAHLAVRHRRHRAVGALLVELTVLSVFFSAVPPVLAVGLYFTFWHAIRHILRLELLDPTSRAALQRGGLLQPFRRFNKDALPLTVCAIGLLVAVALAVHHAGLGTYLLLIAALTTPHTAVVVWMDRRRAPN